jgi:uncharacterized cupredoxin-like copper-binding protein
LGFEHKSHEILGEFKKSNDDYTQEYDLAPGKSAQLILHNNEFILRIAICEEEE